MLAHECSRCGHAPSEHPAVAKEVDSVLAQWYGGATSGFLPRAPQPFDDSIEHRREEQSEERHANQAAEHGHAQRDSHFGTGSLGDDKRAHAENCSSSVNFSSASFCPTSPVPP